ncbi:hypothetical protein [Pseudomonas sp. B21-053]|uniref:hypothetical protein n=1 Tax=Pseudomonas sp. B21-053 TaxID=2895493 RepID=UPI00222E50E2|nr:hypothetical protein [Pseudomonas sp. B21-053]UZE13958.1 hypothetical protein LOY68_10195 [Pseudomonas sp. B21-053]
MLPVAAAEHREAAFGGEAVVRSGDAVFQEDRALRFYDGFAAERSLAGLGSCYESVFNQQLAVAVVADKEVTHVCS